MDTKAKVTLASVIGLAVLALGMMGFWVSTVSGERNSLADERDLLAAENSQLEEEKDVLVSARDSLASERDDLASEKEALTADKDRLTSARDSLTEENDSLTEEVSSLTTERDFLTRELNESQTQKEVLSQRLANTAERVVSSSEELDEAKAQNAALVQRLANTEESVGSLTRELEDAQDSLTGVNSQLASLNNTKRELEAFQDSLQGYWSISADNVLTLSFPFNASFYDFDPFVYVSSYRQSDEYVFTIVEDSSIFTSSEISSFKMVEAQTWDETRNSIRLEVDLSKGRAKLSEGAYYFALVFNRGTEYESFTYLDFTVE